MICRYVENPTLFLLDNVFWGGGRRGVDGGVNG